MGNQAGSGIPFVAISWGRSSIGLTGIIHENPETWPSGGQGGPITEIKQTLKLKRAYAGDCLPIGVRGLNAGPFDEYVSFIADRRLARIGLSRQYAAKNRSRG